MIYREANHRKKNIVYIAAIFLSGCISSTGHPFVKKDSGQPYATVSGLIVNNGLGLLIGSIDGRFSRKSIFGEGMFAGDYVYVTPGSHAIDVTCYFPEQQKYSTVNLSFEARADERYTISCKPDASASSAIYRLVDSNENSVPFKINKIDAKGS